MPFGESHIIVCNHVVGAPGNEIYGPGDALTDFLASQRSRRLMYIRFGLYDQHYPVRLTTFHEGLPIPDRRGPDLSRLPGPVRYFVQACAAITIGLLCKEPVHLWVGCNGLNTLPGLFLKRCGLVRRVIFYTIDYVPRRFKNPLLNGLYHWIDRLCVRSADQVWNNSAAMCRIRADQGLRTDRNIRVPHGADLSKITIPGPGEFDRHAMVMVGNLTAAIRFDLIILALRDAALRDTRAKLILVGSGPSESSIRHLIAECQMEKHVVFSGRMDHTELLQMLPRCGVGLAIYGNTFDWNLHSDSLKVKEYIACGLPVIMAGAPAAQEEVAQSGAVRVVDIDPGIVSGAIVELLTDDAAYARLRNGALRFRESLDWGKLFGPPIRTLLSDPSGAQAIIAPSRGS